MGDQNDVVEPLDGSFAAEAGITGKEVVQDVGAQKEDRKRHGPHHHVTVGCPIAGLRREQTHQQQHAHRAVQDGIDLGEDMHIEAIGCRYLDPVQEQHGQEYNCGKHPNDPLGQRLGKFEQNGWIGLTHH